LSGYWNIGSIKINRTCIPKNFLSWFQKKTAQIAKNPYVFKSTEFKDVRVVPMGNFSIYYKITNQHIIISAFWDNRQDPKHLLRLLENKT